MKEGYVRERDEYEKDHPDLARKRRRVNLPKPAAKVLPSPTESPGIDSRPPVTPSAAKTQGKDAKHSSKKDRSPKSERKKEKEKDKEPEKDKKRRRKSEVK